MRVKVLVEFPYSPHGYDNAVAAPGVQELPDHIAQVALDERWAEPVADEKGEADRVPAGPTHELNAAKAVALVETLDDPTALEAVRASETAHPGYPGGRTTVLRAIEERLAELKGSSADPASEA